MLDHISLGVTDLHRATVFYDALFRPLGFVRVWSSETSVGYGMAGSDDRFALKARPGAASPGAGFHLAFVARSREGVIEAHRAALLSGGASDGEPGLRPQYGPGYFAAFLRDPDGHAVEVVCHEPETKPGVSTERALRELLGEPTELVRAKVARRLNALTKKFIEASPFLCLATSDDAGNLDVSPRGDPVGFVTIVNDETLLIPERPGNRIADSLSNILRNPHVGLLFFIPGVGDTFRVNGRATLTTDVQLLQPCAVEGRTPKIGILVHIELAFTHCSKAFLRSSFWDPSRYVDRATLPTAGEIHKELAGGHFDAEAYDAERAARYARREGFY